MKMKNKVYDTLKWVAIIVTPALSTLVGTVGIATGYQHTDLVVTLIGAVGVFLASVLGVSNASYRKGDE